MLVLDAPGFDHHRFGDRYLLFPRFWDCRLPVSVVTKRGCGRARKGVPPLVDWGVRVLFLDAPGFGHHRFGGRCLLFFRFWDCTRPVLVVAKRGRGRAREGVPPLGEVIATQTGIVCPLEVLETDVSECV